MKRSSSTPPSSRQSTLYWAPPIGDLRDVVGEQPLQQRARAGPAAFRSRPCARRRRPRTRSRTARCSSIDALVLDRHLPAGEVDELGARRAVALEQGRAPQRDDGGRHAPQASGGPARPRFDSCRRFAHTRVPARPAPGDRPWRPAAGNDCPACRRWPQRTHRRCSCSSATCIFARAPTGRARPRLRRAVARVVVLAPKPSALLLSGDLVGLALSGRL